MDKVAWIWKKMAMHETFFTPQQRSYRYVACPGNYQNVK